MHLNQSLTPQRACFSLYARLKPPRARQFSRGPASRCLAPSVGASQSGWPRSTACHPSPRQDRRVSRPAACVRPAGRTASRPAQGWGGVRWRGGATGWARAVGGKGRLIFLYSADRAPRASQPRAGSRRGRGERGMTMLTRLARKTEGRRGSQRRLEEGGAMWVSPHNVVFSPDASWRIIIIAPRSVSRKSGAVQPLHVEC
jgi:hypothetical protein